jgi:UPF0755 protein
MTPIAGPRRAPVVLFLALIFGAGLWFVFRPAGASTPVRFVVPQGAPARDIASQLEAQHLIGHRWIFLVWTKIYRKGAIRPGIYSLDPRDTARSILRELQHGPPLVKTTFPEGWTSKQMAALLESRGVTSASDFLTQVNKDKREGYLFPDTYFFEQGLPAAQVINRLIRRFHEKEPRDMVAQAKALHLSYAQIVTLASMVEKEARAPQERPIIAGVFYNRLRKHWRLESCATVEYALGTWKPQLTYKDLEVESPYNTYRHSGLPPGPICNPGAASLEAAAHPVPTDMMFFVADGQGTHRFSKYYKEHLAAQGVIKP